MKSIVLIFSTFLAIQMNYVSAKPSKEEFLKHLDNCQKKENLDEGIVKAVEEMKLSDIAEGKCIFACLMEEIGVLKNNKISKEDLMNYTQNLYQDDNEKQEKATDVTDKCIKEGEESNGDRCEVAFNLVKCVQKNAPDLLLNH
ncbi:uncharacterized protein LOC142331464 [Lycorma delicatula]|uniref:uncharacterized protein LOC142331464 n=1 Tax=Lycorma delicatula TaxID=130591 RepID=UPI003F50FD95